MDQTILPPLRWEKRCWVSKITLPEWSGFLDCSGPYNGINSTAPSNGTLDLVLNSPEEQDTIFPEQIAAFAYLKEHGEAIRDAILAALFAKYPEWQKEYGYDDDEKALYMPDLEEATQLRSLLGPASIVVHTVAKDDMAYLGFDCGCTWEDEHGLGVLVHGTRVVEIGYADTAFLSSDAIDDGGIDLAPPPPKPQKEVLPEEPDPTQFSLFE